MPPGSTVLVQRGADGIYSQPALTFTGSGAAGKPIKFIGENGVRITGTRVKPDASAWTLVPGRRYTYQLDWDEVAQFPAVPVATAPGGELAADLGRGSPAAIHDAVESTLRSLVSAALLRPYARSMKSRPRPARRGTTPRTTKCMSTSSTTPRRRATERTCI